PVIISTNTINLQEQLINKDIPDLRRALDTDGSQYRVHDLEVAQLKGRTNYLCTRRWNTWRQTPGLPWEETRFLLRLLLWLQSTVTGDRTELSLMGGEVHMWNRVCASDDNCVVERCPHYPSSCFLYRARGQAQQADIIVVNHALLLSDLAKQCSTLPEYHYLIVDEAHHLEEEATEQLGCEIGETEVYVCLEHFSDRGGFLYHLRNYLRTTSVASCRQREIEQAVQGLLKEAGRARTGVSELFQNMTRVVDLQLGESGNYERHLRLSKDARGQSGWPDVALSWENLDLELADLEAGLCHLYSTADDLPNRRSSDLDGSLAEMASLRQQINGIRSRLGSVIGNPETDDVCWASVRSQGGVSLHAAPLRVGQLLDRHLFSKKNSVVLTSATLTTGGTFDYVKECLGLGEVRELVVEAPFDYPQSTMIYLPEDIPEPVHITRRAAYRLRCRPASPRRRSHRCPGPRDRRQPQKGSEQVQGQSQLPPLGHIGTLGGSRCSGTRAQRSRDRPPAIQRPHRPRFLGPLGAV
ncbi:MAG: hypothetical protein NTU41_01220, partial [Chloroflexi bacterium]|nr:hypothetical protein [Chloroflexota bacterium]